MILSYFIQTVIPTFSHQGISRLIDLLFINLCVIISLPTTRLNLRRVIAFLISLGLPAYVEIILTPLFQSSKRGNGTFISGSIGANSIRVPPRLNELIA